MYMRALESPTNSEMKYYGEYESSLVSRRKKESDKKKGKRRKPISWPVVASPLAHVPRFAIGLPHSMEGALQGPHSHPGAGY